MKPKNNIFALIILVVVLITGCTVNLQSANAQITPGTLNIAISPNTPDETIIAVGTNGGMNIPLTAVDFTTGWEAMKITEIEVKIAGTAPSTTYQHIKLYEGSTQIGLTMLPAGATTIKFELLYDYPIIPANSKKTLTLRADLNGIGTGASTGQTVQLNIEANKVKAIGETTGIEVTASGSAIGKPMILRKSAPVFSTSVNSPSPSSVRIAGTQTLYQWNISVEPAGDYWETSLGWKNILFTISGSITVEGTKYTIGYIGSETSIPSTEGVWMTNGSVAKLLIPKNSIGVYDGSTLIIGPPGEGLPNPNVTVTNSPNGSTISGVASTVDEAIMGGGQTKFYNLRGLLELGTTPGDIILIRVPSIAKSLITSNYATVASGDASFVWTDRSAVSHSITTNDWTNDYKVSGIYEKSETIITTNTVFEAGEYNFENLIITNGAKLILKSDPSSEKEFKGVRINAENLIVDSDSAILADSAGYLGGQGTGAGKTSVSSAVGDVYYCGSGAGYGGKGGVCSGAEGGSSYGDLYHPTDLGSGGGNAPEDKFVSERMGGAGGGAVIINITNTLNIKGAISTNGGDGGYFYRSWSGGGSGGSIYITTNILTGSGFILANGGNAVLGNGVIIGGGGGGGRIAIYYNSKDGFTGFIQARGGKGFRDGEPGTIFLIGGEPPPETQLPVLLVHGFQFGCFNPNEIWKQMIKILTGVEIEFINTGLQVTTPDCGTEEIKVVKQTESVYQVGKIDERGISMIRVEGNGLVIYTSNYTHNTLKPTFNDIRNYAKNLANEIQFIKNIEDVNKVNIVAHNMGGLVARSYIEVNDLKNLQDAYDYGELVYNNDVRKLIMLGTPNNGVELAVIGVLLPATKEYQHIKKCSEEYAICALDCLFASEKEREECIDKCIEKCTECLGDIEELKRRLVEDYSYFSIAQLMPEEYNRFLKILNTPNVINFETEYSAIAGNYCDIAGVVCFREFLFPIGDGRVTVESAVKLNEIPDERRYIYPLKHSELPNATLSTIAVGRILRGLEPVGTFIVSSLHSPGELRVYDSEGRVTGLVSGEAKEEISNSIYDAENETVIIFDPFDSYRYEVVGTEAGTYGLEITSVGNGEAISFTATDIPTTAGQNHQYIIDWGIISQGEKGVTLQIDADGDGIFDQTVTADNNLTYDEFILQTETVIDFNPDTLNLENKGKFVTAYIELPEGFEINQIDISSIMLNSLVPVLAKPTEIGDYDGDGTPDLMVKFERSEVQSVLSPGDEINLTLTGKVFYNGNYIDFKGFDMIRVVDPGGSKK